VLLALATLLAAAAAASSVVEPHDASGAAAHGHESKCIHEQVQAETLHTTMSLDALAAAEQSQTAEHQKRQAASAWRP